MKTILRFVAVLICVVLPRVAPADDNNTIKSRCFSDVCLGDDLAKLTGMTIPWMDLDYNKDLVTKKKSGLPNGGGQIHQDPEALNRIASVYRGLPAEQINILGRFYIGGFGSSGGFMSEGTVARSLLPGPMNNGAGPPYLIATQGTLNALKASPALCGALPVVGMFKSEGGNLTTVFLWPEGGKLVVSRLSRIWVPTFPPETSNTQRNQLIANQFSDLMKDIGRTYGGAWRNDGDLHAASDPYTVMYFSEGHWDNSGPRPNISGAILTLYTHSLAAYQGSGQPVGRIGTVRVVTNPTMDVNIDFDRATKDVEVAGANLPACAVGSVRMPLN